jgi:hypothetical protein
MAFPITKIEIAFNDGPYVASPTWTDVTTDVRSLSVKRGRSDDYSQFPTGSATVVLSNRTEKYNPLNTAGVYYGKLLPRRQIRIQAKVNAGSVYQDVWRGYISGWPVSWTQGGLDSTVTIQCFDMLGLLADTQFAADWSYPTIAALNPRHWWRCNDTEGSTSLTDIGSTPVALQRYAGSLATYNYPTLTPGLPFDASNLGYASKYRTNTPTTSMTSCSVFEWVSTTDYSVPSFRGWNGNYLFIMAMTSTGSVEMLTVDIATNTYYSTVSTVATLNTYVPHHMGFTWNATTKTNKLYVDGQDVTGATTTGFTSTPASAEQWEIWSQIFQEIVIFDSVLTASQVASIYNAGVPQFTETTGARATRLMQTTSVPAALYNVTATPANTVQQISNGGLVVAEMQKTSDSEGGDLFIDKSGVMQFTNQYYAATQGASPDVITFDDSPGSNPYGQNLDVEYTADDIANDVIVTFSGGGNVRTVSSTSQTSSGVASTTIDTYLSTVTGATNLANYELSIRSVLKPQVSAIEASVARTETQWYDVLNLELLSPFTITRTPPAGTVFTQKMIVNSISHDISPSGWRTSIQGSARYTGWFVLDYSALDGPDLLL